MSRAVHLASLVALLAVGALGCGQPPVDCIEDTPGCDGLLRPPPQAVIEGTVLYRGPPPMCRRNPDGSLVTPIRPVGKLVVFLWDHDDPPPPDGDETEPIDLLTVPASAMFPGLTAEECAAEDAPPDDETVIVERAVDFLWPSIEVPWDRDLRARIVGHFDRDDSFIPFFSARATPTLGDVIGGVVDQRGVPEPVSFRAGRERTDGQRRSDVTITVSRVVNTEPPVFTLSSTTGALSSAATIPTERDDPDPARRERALFELAGMQLSLVNNPDEAFTAALRAAGMSIDTSLTRLAWFAREVDYDEDGVQDFHPVLGDEDDGTGIQWYYPAIVMPRARPTDDTDEDENDDPDEPIIPNVAMVPSVRPLSVAVTKGFYPRLMVTIPPIAAVDLVAEDEECRVVYVPPGNVITAYEPDDDETLTTCQELPTGRYDVVVFHGAAGATLSEVSFVDSQVCDDMGRCFLWTGGRSAEQIWSIPNELGDPEEISAAVPDSQGVEVRFTVHDETPDDIATCTSAYDPRTGGMRDIVFPEIPERCCEAVQHLCALPLCAPRMVTPNTAELSYFESVREDDQGLMIRAVTDADLDAEGRPTCTPFSMPPQCCR